MGDQNHYCKHDTLAAYCGDCMIELRAENAELRKDAERYRYFKKCFTHPVQLHELAVRIGCKFDEFAPTLDAAIDAAMNATNG